MDPKDLTCELWREYDFNGRVYRIDLPQTLYVGATTHRVFDCNGVTHCVPAPGFHGCVVKWKHKDGFPAVTF